MEFLSSKLQAYKLKPLALRIFKIPEIPNTYREVPFLNRFTTK